MINTCASSYYKKLGGNLRWPGIDFSPPSPHTSSTPPPAVSTRVSTETTLQCRLVSRLINIIAGLLLHFIPQPVTAKNASEKVLHLLRFTDVEKQKHISCLLLLQAAPKDEECSRSHWPAT